jgi:hypothetical protein
MKAIELIRWAMRMTDEGVARLVEDMRDVPLTQPTSRGGNHPLWTMGHLAWIEGNLRRIVRGDPSPVEHWTPLFRTGTQPLTDAKAYPPFDEVLHTFRELRKQNLKMLEEVGDAGLDRPPAWVPPGFEDAMKTVGQTFLLVTLHQMVHYGQIAVARRAAGREPLM